MPTVAQEKPVGAKLRLSADFTSALISGESVVGANVTVTAVNAMTDATAAGVLLGVPVVSGNVISQDVQGGTLGDVYLLTFKTGTTSAGLAHEASMHLVITNAPASETILCSRDELKRHLRITDTSEDTLLDDMLVAASGYFRQRTGRDVDLRTYTETIQPQRGQNNVRLRLWNYPVQRVDKIETYTSEGDLIESFTDQTKWDVLPEGYVWFNDGEVFYYFPEKNIITYRAGYPKVPDDIREAVKRLATGFYRMIGREGISAERIGDYSWQKTAAKDLFPPRIRKEVDDDFVEGVVARYRRHDQDVY